MTIAPETNTINPAPGPCAGCGETFDGELLDDAGLCIACDAIAYEKAVKAAADAEDAALYSEGMRIWQEALAEVQAQDFAKAEADYKEYLSWADPDATLLARERAVKGREIARRERRQDTRDLEEGQTAEDTGEPLSTFEMPMDGSDIDVAPTAMLRRQDGATLLYDHKLNWLFGVPGSGKSWVALHVVHEALLRGQRAIYWDFEDVIATLAQRSLLMGLDLADFWRDGVFKYLRPGVDGSDLAMAQACTWIAGGDGPTLVVIDSAESAGCPSGRDRCRALAGQNRAALP